jgi:hypothetical protein
VSEHYLSQQPLDSEDSPAGDLGRYKAALENIRNLLLYGANLRKMTNDDLDTFDNDLREVIKGIEKLRHAPQISNFLKSVDAVQEKIRSAINELNVALNVIESETIDPQDSWRSYFTCLSNCQR